MKKQLSHRQTYRHGNLRAALIEAGLDLARAAGPDAVVLREATRRSGVVPNAAYRHFADRDCLLAAVRGEALALLAARMRQALSEAPAGSTSEAARARLRAIGSAYVMFAQQEPGLFRTAFSGPDTHDPGGADSLDGDSAEVALDHSGPEERSQSLMTPYGLLATALDDLVTAGALTPQRRPSAEFSAWSSVHGLAMLLIAGPLQELDEAHVRHAVDHLLDVVDRGLTT